MGERDPQLPGERTPLDGLIRRALRLYGDFAAGASDSEIALDFLWFANLVVDDVNAHPYREGFEPIAPYTSLSDVRDIPETVLVAGLMAKYAMQQQAESKIQIYLPTYNSTLNRDLWYAVAGNSSLQVRPRDGGSNRKLARRTNPYTGMPE